MDENKESALEKEAQESLEEEQTQKLLKELAENVPAVDEHILDNSDIFSATEEVVRAASETPQNSRLQTKKQKEDSVPVNTVPSPQADKQPAEGKQQKNNWVKELRDWVVAIVIAVAVSLVIRNFVFTLVKVQGASMEPTLQNEDRLYVNRLFYTPEKGDVIIFKPASDPKRPYVKRVIATEGDSIYIDFQSGDVYVNDEIIDEPYIKDKTARTGSYIMDLVAKGEYGKDMPIVIQPGYIFVMGDNRNNSKDSRELGQVPVDEVMGGAVFRFWPLDNLGSVHRDASIHTSFALPSSSGTGLE